MVYLLLVSCAIFLFSETLSRRGLGKTGLRRATLVAVDRSKSGYVGRRFSGNGRRGACTTARRSHPPDRRPSTTLRTPPPPPTAIPDRQTLPPQHNDWAGLPARRAPPPVRVIPVRVPIGPHRTASRRPFDRRNPLAATWVVTRNTHAHASGYTCIRALRVRAHTRTQTHRHTDTYTD